MTANATLTPQPAAETSEILDKSTTTCCVVGGGPAGVVLSLLLARKGIPVMLLETHQDFDREFRGDTIHPSVMEIMINTLDLCFCMTLLARTCSGVFSQS